MPPPLSSPPPTPRSSPEPPLQARDRLILLASLLSESRDAQVLRDYLRLRARIRM